MVGNNQYCKQIKNAEDGSLHNSHLHSGNFENINLIKNSFSSNLSIENGDKEINNSWRGKYFFERTNRDDLKTSFEISINNLKNISLVYVSDGEKPEAYKGIVGEMISDNKMKNYF